MTYVNKLALSIALLLCSGSMLAMNPQRFNRKAEKHAFVTANPNVDEAWTNTYLDARKAAYDADPVNFDGQTFEVDYIATTPIVIAQVNPNPAPKRQAAPTLTPEQITLRDTLLGTLSPADAPKPDAIDWATGLAQTKVCTNRAEFDAIVNANSYANYLATKKFRGNKPGIFKNAWNYTWNGSYGPNENRWKYGIGTAAVVGFVAAQKYSKTFRDKVSTPLYNKAQAFLKNLKTKRSYQAVAGVGAVGAVATWYYWNGVKKYTERGCSYLPFCGSKTVKP